MTTVLQLGAKVEGQNGQDYGEVKYLVADPQTDQVTHLVVDSAELDDRQLLVEIGHIHEVSSDGKLVVLSLSPDELKARPDFMEREYVNTNLTEGDQSFQPRDSMSFMYPSRAADGSAVGSVAATNSIVEDAIIGTQVGPVGMPVSETLNVPEDSLIIRAGATVEALDGRVGVIKRVNMDEAGRIVDFVIEQGFLFTHDVSVPANMVDSATTDSVYLRVNKSDVKEAASQAEAEPNDPNSSTAAI